MIGDGDKQRITDSDDWEDENATTTAAPTQSAATHTSAPVAVTASTATTTFPSLDKYVFFELWVLDPPESVPRRVGRPLPIQRTDTILYVARFALQEVLRGLSDKPIGFHDVLDPEVNVWLSCAAKPKRWHALDVQKYRATLIKNLSLRNRSVCDLETPQILIAPPLQSNDQQQPMLPPTTNDNDEPTGTDALAPPVLSPTSSTSSSTISTTDSLDDVPTVERSAQADTSAGEWPSTISIDTEVDIFDATVGQWREGFVVDCSGSSNTTENDRIDVQLRGTVEDRVISTSRHATSGTASPRHGDIAKAFTKVSDWRARLKKGMDIELLVNKYPIFYNAEKDMVIHFVKSGPGRHGCWWVSRRENEDFKAVETTHSDVQGYLRTGTCKLSQAPPPTLPRTGSAAEDNSTNTSTNSTEQPPNVWELWNGAWQESTMVTVAVETIESHDYGGIVPVVTISVDDELAMFRSFDDDEWPQRMTGTSSYVLYKKCLPNPDTCFVVTSRSPKCRGLHLCTRFGLAGETNFTA